MESPLLVILGVLATGASLSCAIPQLWRVLRTRETRGISTSSQLALLSCLAAWSVYGCMTPDAALAISSIVPLVSVWLTCILLARAGAGSALRTNAVLGVSVLLAVLVGTQSLSTVALYGTVVGLAGMLPQLRTSVVERRCPGLSSASWALSGARAVLWMGYGVASGQTVLWVGSAVQLPMIAVIWASAVLGARALAGAQQTAGAGLIPAPRTNAEDSHTPAGAAAAPQPAGLTAQV